MEAEDGGGGGGAEEHVCMVCKEGYRLQPGELLAAYVFCKRLSAAEAGGAAPLEGLALPRSAGFVLSSVSHFNLIHVKCHVAARRADAALRAPKRCDTAPETKPLNSMSRHRIPRPRSNTLIFGVALYLEP